MKSRPPADAGEIPAMPVDEITGERIRNPWVKDPDAKIQDVSIISQ